MKITQNSVVSLNYTLTNKDGTLLDKSDDQEPLTYIHGQGHIIPGLEEALAGKSHGDKFQISIEPEAGYGLYNEAMVQKVPLSMFDGAGKIEPGMQFHAETSNGMQVVTVIAIDTHEATINGNHPLAGEELNFDVEVVGVRTATADELDHGHVHGAGCHHH